MSKTLEPNTRGPEMLSQFHICIQSHLVQGTMGENENLSVNLFFSKQSTLTLGLGKCMGKCRHLGNKAGIGGEFQGSQS